MSSGLLGEIWERFGRTLGQDDISFGMFLLETFGETFGMLVPKSASARCDMDDDVYGDE